RHARVHEGQERNDHQQDDGGMHEPDDRAAQGAGFAGRLEDRHVQEREELAVEEVGEEADDLRPVASLRERRPEQIRDAHPGEMKLLRTSLQRSQQHGPDESSQQRARPVHGLASGICARARSASRLPRSRRSRRDNAALIRPTCVYACGKFPSAAPLAGSISSAKRPTSFAYPSSVSSCSSASAGVPPPSARYSAAQKLQIPNAPSPAVSPP